MRSTRLNVWISATPGYNRCVTRMRPPSSESSNLLAAEIVADDCSARSTFGAWPNGGTCSGSIEFSAAVRTNGFRHGGPSAIAMHQYDRRCVREPLVAPRQQRNDHW